MTNKEALLAAITVLEENPGHFNITNLAGITITVETTEVIEKLEKMIDKSDKPSASEIKKREARDARYKEIAEQVATILPEGEENAMNSSEILAAIGNPADISTNKMAYIMVDDRFVKTTKNKRVAYYLTKEEKEETL